jgi:hypothetical protein
MITDDIDVKDSLSIMLIPAKKVEGKKNESKTKPIPSLPSGEADADRNKKRGG